MHVGLTRVRFSEWWLPSFSVRAQLRGDSREEGGEPEPDATSPKGKGPVLGGDARSLGKQGFTEWRPRARDFPDLESSYQDPPDTCAHPNSMREIESRLAHSKHRTCIKLPHRAARPSRGPPYSSTLQPDPLRLRRALPLVHPGGGGWRPAVAAMWPCGSTHTLQALPVSEPPRAASPLLPLAFLPALTERLALTSSLRLGQFLAPAPFLADHLAPIGCTRQNPGSEPGSELLLKQKCVFIMKIQTFLWHTNSSLDIYQIF